MKVTSFIILTFFVRNVYGWVDEWVDEWMDGWMDGSRSQCSCVLTLLVGTPN